MELKIDPAAARRVRQEITLESSLNKMKNVIVVQSGKGGVGKSSVSINLAVGLAEKGLKVGLIDADMTGPSIPLMAGAYGKDAEIRDQKIIPFTIHGVQIVSMDLLIKANTPVIWRGPLLMAALRQFLSDVAWEEVDVLVLDLPPGTSDLPLSVSQLFEGKITGTVIVTTPQQVSVHDVKKSINFASQVKMPIMGVIENMSGLTCPNCNHHIDVFNEGGGKNAAEELGLNFLGTIPLDPEVVKQADDGIPSILKEGKFKEAFTGIIAKIEKFLVLN